jgi:hypothetical protein
MGPSLEPKVIPPPPDIQPIIDRMAMSVAKNGVEFEIVGGITFGSNDGAMFEYYVVPL